MIKTMKLLLKMSKLQISKNFNLSIDIGESVVGTFYLYIDILILVY